MESLGFISIDFTFFKLIFLCLFLAPNSHIIILDFIPLTILIMYPFFTLFQIVIYITFKNLYFLLIPLVLLYYFPLKNHQLELMIFSYNFHIFHYYLLTRKLFPQTCLYHLTK